MRRLVLLSLMLLALFLFAGCQENDEDDTAKKEKAEDATTYEETDKKPIVTITMEDGREIMAELYPNIAQNTVNNFIELIENEFYDGVIFHRVIPGFMIQSGDPEGTGMGDPGYSIKGEFENNGVENDLKHEKGVLSMARREDPDSAGSQFFIMTGEAASLDGNYAAFGKVIDGMDVAEDISEVERDSNDMPKEDQVIEKITVDLEGYDAKPPEKIE